MSFSVIIMVHFSASATEFRKVHSPLLIGYCVLNFYSLLPSCDLVLTVCFFSLFFLFIVSAWSNSHPIWNRWRVILRPCRRLRSQRSYLLWTRRIPFMSASPNQSAWHLSFRSWPTKVEGWREWYVCVSASKSAQWEELGISQAINNSLADPVKNESFLVGASHFWSDSLNAFLFSHGPSSPSLMDIYMLMGLGITFSTKIWDLWIKTHHHF